MGLREVLWSLRHPLSSPPLTEEEAVEGSPYWYGRGGGYVGPGVQDQPTDDQEGNEFSYPASNRITSNRGFSVDVGASSAIRYQESGRTMEISAERLSGPEETIAVRRTDVQAWEGSAGREIDVTDRARIVENIRRALASKGWTLQVEE